MNDPQVTIVVVPRERFSLTERFLRNGSSFLHPYSERALKRLLSIAFHRYTHTTSNWPQKVETCVQPLGGRKAENA